MQPTKMLQRIYLVHTKLSYVIKEKISDDYLDVAKNVIEGMVCSKNDPIPLDTQKILQALSIDGEVRVFGLKYDELDSEIKEQFLKEKILHSLSIIVKYEVKDSDMVDRIEKFTDYIYNFCDKKQNFIFGVKQVEEYSQYPVTVLFSGILPINQFYMHIGRSIKDLIDSDREYFSKRFEKLRDDVSDVINIPLLPLFPKVDTKLKDNEVKIFDSSDNSLVCEFEVDASLDKNNIEIYLLKLYYLYISLVQKKATNAKAA